MFLGLKDKVKLCLGGLDVKLKDTKQCTVKILLLDTVKNRITISGHHYPPARRFECHETDCSSVFQETGGNVTPGRLAR